MNLTFKAYEEKDFNDLKEMVFGLYEEDPEGLPITADKIQNTIREMALHPEKIQIIMIQRGGAVIGYSILVFSWSNEYGGDIVDIDELYIKKDCRNKQAASDFIKSRMTAYKNAVSLRLETTPSNADAERLYKRLGFEPSQNNYMIRQMKNG